MPGQHEDRILSTNKVYSDSTQTEQLVESPTDNQLTTLYLKIFEMNETLLKLNASFQQLKNGWDDVSLKIQSTATQVESANQKLIGRYETINQAQLDFIEEHAKVLKAYRNQTPIAWLKSLLRPHIGTLHQYDSRAHVVPSHYHQKKALSSYPTISIVTPSFNQGHFLEKTILSVINQDYPNTEHIIQDGGSTDNTKEVITRYQSSLKHWESQKDGGQSNAINLGFRHATGDILAYLNSDDILLPGTLHYVAQYFLEHPEVDVVYGHRVVIDEHDFEIGRWILPPHSSKVLAWADYIPQETLFWRKSIWEKSGGKIDESFRFAMDWDLLLRFREANARFVRLPRFLGAFRVHSQQKTSSEMTNVGNQEMERLRVRCHGRHVGMREIKNHLRFYQLKHLICHKLYHLGLLKY